MRKIVFTILAIIAGGLFFKSFCYGFHDNVVLEKNSVDSIYSGHHSHCSHSSHAAHHSHYSCMLSRADSIGAITVHQYSILKGGIEANPKQKFVSAFKANSVADNGYDGKSGFNGESVLAIIIEDIKDAQWTSCNFLVKCIAIPIDKCNRNYYVYSENAFQKKNVNITLIK